MNALENALDDFYSCAEDICIKWSDKCKEIEPYFNNVKLRAEQLQLHNKLILDKVLLEKFPDLQDRSITDIELKLEDEKENVNEIWNVLLEMKNQISSKLDIIERCSFKVNIANSLTKYPDAPPVYKLIEYAENIARYYNTLSIKMSYALVNIELHDINTIEHAQNVFFASSELNNNIEGYILQWKMSRDE